MAAWSEQSNNNNKKKNFTPFPFSSSSFHKWRNIFLFCVSYSTLSKISIRKNSKLFWSNWTWLQSTKIIFPPQQQPKKRRYKTESSICFDLLLFFQVMICINFYVCVCFFFKRERKKFSWFNLHGWLHCILEKKQMRKNTHTHTNKQANNNFRTGKFSLPFKY